MWREEGDPHRLHQLGTHRQQLVGSHPPVIIESNNSQIRILASPIHLLL